MRINKSGSWLVKMTYPLKVNSEEDFPSEDQWVRLSLWLVKKTYPLKVTDLPFECYWRRLTLWMLVMKTNPLNVSDEVFSSEGLWRKLFLWRLVKKTYPLNVSEEDLPSELSFSSDSSSGLGLDSSPDFCMSSRSRYLYVTRNVKSAKLMDSFFSCHLPVLRLPCLIKRNLYRVI